MKIKRKLYVRGSSFETTIPKPLLLFLDTDKKKYDVIFVFDKKKKKWYLDFAERK